MSPLNLLLFILYNHIQYRNMSVYEPFLVGTSTWGSKRSTTHSSRKLATT